MRASGTGRKLREAEVVGTAWLLDPLADETGTRLDLHQIAIVRIACVAAETGSRMQRDGLGTDPLRWMATPNELFEGRAPIEACMERDGCAKAILLHGLGLPLDTQPAVIESILKTDARMLEEASCD